MRKWRCVKRTKRREKNAILKFLLKKEFIAERIKRTLSIWKRVELAITVVKSFCAFYPDELLPLPNTLSIILLLSLPPLFFLELKNRTFSLSLALCHYYCTRTEKYFSLFIYACTQYAGRVDLFRSFDMQWKAICTRAYTSFMT